MLKLYKCGFLEDKIALNKQLECGYPRKLEQSSLGVINVLSGEFRLKMPLLAEPKARQPGQQ